MVFSMFAMAPVSDAWPVWVARSKEALPTKRFPVTVALSGDSDSVVPSKLITPVRSPALSVPSGGVTLPPMTLADPSAWRVSESQRKRTAPNSTLAVGSVAVAGVKDSDAPAPSAAIW